MMAATADPSIPGQVHLERQAERMRDGDRFDKFTERARRTLSLAQEEARRFNHNYIGTEHLLLGLIRDDQSVAAHILDTFGVQLQQVRSAVEFIIGRGDRITLGELGLTPRAKMVIELAVDEARRLDHHYIGTEHLLLGLIREGEGIAAGVLQRLGIDLERVRAAVLQGLREEPDDFAEVGINQEAMRAAPGLDVLAGHLFGQYRLSHYTADARHVLVHTQDEARQLHHTRIGTGHLLLGLASVEQGIAAQALVKLGAQPAAIRSAVAFVQSGEDNSALDLIVPFRHLDRVFAAAADEARRLGHMSIGTEHLLLGLCQEPESIAAGVLASVGIQREQVRQTVLEIMHQQGGGAA
jgi:ATP-dependent Clp protease ATP-binding subunit ClpA